MDRRSPLPTTKRSGCHVEALVDPDPLETKQTGPHLEERALDGGARRGGRRKALR
jgi:hypothetical protein